MIKGIERALPMARFKLRTVEARRHGVPQDSPPRVLCIDYEVIVEMDENDRGFEPLHTHVRKFGRVTSTVAAAVQLKSRLPESRRREGSCSQQHRPKLASESPRVFRRSAGLGQPAMARPDI